ncbi:hypothetical protein LTR50_004246 [Elasticomyces elasticus]|nr:hypothetical protein LTR50_004246 [Elasticomyces elasticus]
MSANTPFKPSPLSFNSPRASPFRRPESPLMRSPSTARAATPTSSPTKQSSSLLAASPTKSSMPLLSPEKPSNPFIRRPSQNTHGSARPASPFARPTSRLEASVSPERKSSSPNILEPPAPPARPLPSPAVAEIEADPFDSRPPSSAVEREVEETFDGASSSPPPASPCIPRAAETRPQPQRTVTSSTTTTIRAPSFSNTTPKPPATTPATNPPHTYTHIPPSTLRSMRESFQVLNTSNSGSLRSADIAQMLDQLNLPSTPSALADFFPPPHHTQQATTSVNLARYLDILCAPLAALSREDELAAAFAAFDVDDSGQIDVEELRDALLHTAPEPGEGGERERAAVRLGEGEIDGILGGFAGRRAFGAKGLGAAKGKGKAEVFRYREFMGSVMGGGMEGGAEEVGLA